ncbi:MAG: KilA-N domain-containing protein [Bacteroidales bacterium]|nr:KilA-N domain-containing protein [Bacteroidales bacterium]
MQTQNGRQDVKLQKVMKYEGNKIAFELTEKDVMINVTQFAKAFPDKNLSTIINSSEIQDYVKKLAEIKNFSSADLLTVRKGGNNRTKQGTWANSKVALRIAQKLSTEFAIHVDMFLEELITKGKVEIRKPNQLSETASYKEGQMFPQKMGDSMVLGVYKNGELWYQMNRLMRYLAFSESAVGQYKNKIGKENLLKYKTNPGAKSLQYYVNKRGLDEILVLSSHPLNGEFVENVYRDLFRVTIDGKETINTQYPYKFTFEQMNSLFYEVSKIQRVKLQKDIYSLLRRGRVL